MAEDRPALTVNLLTRVRDAEQMFSYWKRSETEIITLAAKAPYILTEPGAPDLMAVIRDIARGG